MIKQRSLSLSILAGVLAAGAGSISAHATDCVGILAPGSYNSLNVPAGQACDITSGSVTVAGNVTVGNGAVLQVLSPAQFTVNSSLLAAGAFAVDIEPAPGAATILGSVSVTGTTGGPGTVTIRNSFIGGTLSVANGTPPGIIKLLSNTVAGNVLDHNNNTSLLNSNVIDNNTIGASLVCTGNTTLPKDNGTPNTVGGAKVGQCSGL